MNAQTGPLESSIGIAPSIRKARLSTTTSTSFYANDHVFVGRDPCGRPMCGADGGKPRPDGVTAHEWANGITSCLHETMQVWRQRAGFKARRERPAHHLEPGLALLLLGLLLVFGLLFLLHRPREDAMGQYDRFTLGIKDGIAFADQFILFVFGQIG